VISKWRAWVDLACAGDVDVARRRLTDAEDGSDVVVERLAEAWTSEEKLIEEWGRASELEALESPHVTTMTADP
jgi:hypothetical protein